MQPAASDSGAALGAALHLHHALPGARRAPALRDVYLGPGYDDDAIAAALGAENLACERVADPACHAAALLAEGKSSAGSRDAWSTAPAPWATARSWPTRAAPT